MTTFWVTLVALLVTSGVVREITHHRETRRRLFLAWAAGWHGAKGGMSQNENPWLERKERPARP